MRQNTSAFPDTSTTPASVEPSSTEPELAPGQRPADPGLVLAEKSEAADALSGAQPAPPAPVVHNPLILSRGDHPISRRNIDEHALYVLYRLASFGYKAYLVGGGVRDLLLGKVPKDFDVGTDARPSRIKKIFRNSRIIGRRFRIAHVFFPDGNIIEVSTFRRGSQKSVKTEDGLIVSDNIYGTPEEDALRRDLTINGLFYDISSFSVIDYVGGVRDLKDGIIRTIANPDLSFREDPVRMIRVLRHAARTGFEIEGSTLRAIYQNRSEIRNANTARLLEEALKDLRGGAAAPFFRLMMETHLLDCLLSHLGAQLREHGPEHPLWRRMEALDRRVQSGATYTSPVLLSLLLQTVLVPDPELWSGHRGNPPDVWRLLQSSWREISKTIRISRRDMERIAQIIICYRKLVQSVEHQRLLPALIKKAYLAESLDFLQVDLESRGQPAEIVDTWRRFATPPQPTEHRYGFAFASGGGPHRAARHPRFEEGGTGEDVEEEEERRSGSRSSGEEEFLSEDQAPFKQEATSEDRAGSVMSASSAGRDQRPHRKRRRRNRHRRRYRPPQGEGSAH